MKKSLMIMAILGLVSFGSFAQDKKPMREKPTPEKQAELRSQRMKKELGLTDAQYNKVYKLNLDEAKKFEAKRNEDLKLMKAAKEKRDKEFASILTPEQLKKMEESKAKRGNFRQERPQVEDLNSDKRFKGQGTRTDRGRTNFQKDSLKTQVKKTLN